MSDLFNVSAIKNKMKDKPKGQRLYDFFYGTDRSVLTKDQIREMRRLLITDHKKTLKFLDDAINSSK